MDNLDFHLQIGLMEEASLGEKPHIWNSSADGCSNLLIKERKKFDNRLCDNLNIKFAIESVPVKSSESYFACREKNDRLP